VDPQPGFFIGGYTFCFGLIDVEIFGRDHRTPKIYRDLSKEICRKPTHEELVIHH